MAGEHLRPPNPIATLNDAFRRAGPTHDWRITRGAAALPDTIGLIRAVMLFDDFTPDNDPWHEHDFCNFTWANDKVYAKIDYYDQALQYGLDPLDPDCRRVLTILLASEW
jgi:hypothetical protein